MDADHEIARAKWLLGALAILLLSSCISWGELTYLVMGRETQADVDKAYVVTRRGRFGTNQGQQLCVDFSFNEPDGTRRTGTDTVRVDWPADIGGKATVRYTPGANGKSRLAGHVNWLGVSLFALSVGCVAVFGFRLLREASEATKELGYKSGKRSKA